MKVISVAMTDSESLTDCCRLNPIFRLLPTPQLKLMGNMQCIYVWSSPSLHPFHPPHLHFKHNRGCFTANHTLHSNILVNLPNWLISLKGWIFLYFGHRSLSAAWMFLLYINELDESIETKFVCLQTKLELKAEQIMEANDT